ncbi:hypothetical protein O181_085488 [Austropuccinia psidii MF-1]|uniref:Uncharacterized protein n=1 Tax=Austropuccinia psidii MF-1 TaxID=1389203 RepID=A0A9Q3FXL6_9BASI|nr:hypothetical protein [Austropuccinia psidii MF-1]
MLQQAPGRILHKSLAIDFTSHRTSSKRQSSHVSHENVSQSPNPFQHYSQFSGNFTSLASASPPNPPQSFASLHACTALHMRLQHCPPISVLTTPYAFTPLPLPSLCALPTCSQHCLPSLCSRSAIPTCSRHQLSLHLCSDLLTSSQHCLPSLRSRSALPTCSRHFLPSLRSRSALPTCSRHHLSLRLCSALPTSLRLRSALPTLLTILTLV